jgi:hypothetical protein
VGEERERMAAVEAESEVMRKSNGDNEGGRRSRGIAGSDNSYWAKTEERSEATMVQAGGGRRQQ